VTLGLCLSLAASACTDSKKDSGASATTLPGTVGPPTINRAHVDDAVKQLRDRITATLKDGGPPGLAFGVVFEDKVVATGGYGVRTLGQPAPIDGDTVFQLASVSKSVSGSVMSALVGKKAFAWDDPMHAPNFALADQYVSDNVSYADLYSHRSGLPDHAGDLLEDLGFPQDAVLNKLRLFPLDPFRSTYAYTNFGLTEAAVAGAAKAGMSFEDAARTELFDPLGMTNTSATFADFMGHPDHATGHVLDGDKWVNTPQQRNPDDQSAAGGISSSINDMMKWLRMELADGKLDGRQIVDADALHRTWLPDIMFQPPKQPDSVPGFYGMGFNINYDNAGRLRLTHSGAFALGASTAVTMYPGDKVGIVVLTNGQPHGEPEAMAASFFDDLLVGHQTQDWVGLIRDVMKKLIYPPPSQDWAHPPAGAAPAGPNDRYVGTYTSDIYGPAEVFVGPSGLQFRIGPQGQVYDLHPYNGDQMWWQFRGENAGPPAAATFSSDAGGKAASLDLENIVVPGQFGPFKRT